MHLSVTVITAVVATALSGAVLAPIAVAADGDNRPSGANPEAWGRYVKAVKEADAVQDWSTPRGRLIADSGFRPYTDGFSFFNMSNPDSANHAVFGSPKSGPKNLDANTLRTMMGKRVCVEGDSEGACTLTLAGKLWRDTTNAAMAGGHCYGVASTAGQLFAGQLAPGQFQAGATTTYDLGLRTPISRQIARNMASQYTKPPMGFLAKPSKVVEELKTTLAAGKTPPVLIMFAKDGGHAVTPYALYEGRDGRYDVAIYDNNYPDFRRVVRLNTVQQTAQYAFQVNPDAPAVNPELDSLGVVPADFITATQPCPFCRDTRHTTVQMQPVKSKVPLKARVTRLNGSPMKSVEVIPPTSPWEPGEPWNFPSFRLPKGKAFLVTINARRSKKAITPSVLATTGGFAVGAHEVKIPAGSVGRIGIDTTSGAVVFKGKDPGEGLLSFVDSGDTRSVSLAGRADSRTKPTAIGGALVGKRQAAVLYPLDRRAGRVVVVAKLQYYRAGRARQKDAVIQHKMPADAALAVSYAKWKPSHPKGLRAYVVRGTERTPVRVRFP